jgi:hypothetical protein
MSEPCFDDELTSEQSRKHARFLGDQQSTAADCLMTFGAFMA